MITIGLTLTEHVKVEGINLIPNVLVIEEKLGDVAQIFRVDLLLFCIKFKHAHCIISVNLVTRRAPDIAAL